MSLSTRSLALLLATTALTAHAQSDAKVAYTDRQYLGNLAYGSSNPVAESHMPLTDIVDIRLDYRQQSGPLHLVDDAGRSTSWSPSFAGLKQVGRTVFAGGLAYDNSRLADRRWNNTLYLSPHNPYVIGDSVAGRFARETFALHGAAVLRATDRLRLGLRAFYDVGSSAKEKDPRPDIKGMRFTLNPGAEYTLGRHALGLSAHVGWLSEESSTTVVRTTTTQNLLLFQGLGIYEARQALGYKRKYNGMRYGANLQYTLCPDSTAALADHIDIGYTGEREDATDGATSTKYKGGRYSGTALTLSNRLSIRPSGRTVHNVTLTAGLRQTTGRWYTQRQTTDADNNLVYTVINENDDYEASRYQAAVAYRLDLLAGTLPTFTVNVSAALDHSTSRHRVYGAALDVTRATLGADATRRFRLHAAWLAATLRASYSTVPSSRLDVTSLPATFAVVRDKYTVPAYDALRADHWGAGASLAYARPLRLLGGHTTVNAALHADYLGQTAALPTLNGAYRLTVGASLGLVF